MKVAYITESTTDVVHARSVLTIHLTRWSWRSRISIYELLTIIQTFDFRSSLVRPAEMSINLRHDARRPYRTSRIAD